MNDTTIQNVFIPGIRDRLFSITVRDGYFSSIAASACSAEPYRKQWISPAFTDLHVHLGWTDFDMADQLKRSSEEIEKMQAAAFKATYAAGFHTVRDAGGMLPAQAHFLDERYGCKLSVFACGDMLGKQDAQGSAFIAEKVHATQKTGAPWLKVFATGGLGSAPEEVLQPLFSKEEFFAAVQNAHSCGIKVMVHTWGGVSLDWAIEAKADSVEHGVYMTEDQAYKLAAAGIPYIPTTVIYRIAARKDGPLALPDFLRERAERAAVAHPAAVQHALHAGVLIGFGTDFATPMLHGHNLEELDSLCDCGLPFAVCWKAATEVSACILGRKSDSGCIREGFIADYNLFSKDPSTFRSVSDVQSCIIS